MEGSNSVRDRYFMRNALNISLRGIGNTCPNPSVGVVIVKNNKILSRGWTQPGGNPHAEVVAIKKKKNLLGTTLYTTLEPCSHYGKSKPCIDQIIKAKISRVVIGLKDPNPKVNGKGIKKLKKKNIKITLGVLTNEIIKTHSYFFHKIKKKHPFIATKIAISKNGKMIDNSRKWITSKESREYGNFLRSKFDAIITGINTVLKDNPSLDCRHFGMEKLSPARIILDSSLKIKENLKIVKTAKKIKTYIFTNNNNQQKILKFRKLGLLIKVIDNNSKEIDLKKAILEINNEDFNSVLLEAGPLLNSAFLKYKMINKIYYFQSSKIIKSKLSKSEKKLNLNNINNLKFKLISSRNINNDKLAIYEK